MVVAMQHTIDLGRRGHFAFMKPPAGSASTDYGLDMPLSLRAIGIVKSLGSPIRAIRSGSRSRLNCFGVARRGGVTFRACGNSTHRLLVEEHDNSAGPGTLRNGSLSHDSPR